MKINVTKLTNVDLARKACQYTLHSHAETKIGLRTLYGAEHSPARTQMFWIEMQGIPSYVSTHFVRHKIGVEHFVKTNRLDRGATTVADRNTPVNHAMLINAQAIINISRKRFCSHADEVTREVWKYVKNTIKDIDPDLAEFMVVDCVYRGKCYEPSSCGLAESFFGKYDCVIPKHPMEGGEEESG